MSWDYWGLAAGAEELRSGDGVLLRIDQRLPPGAACGRLYESGRWASSDLIARYRSGELDATGRHLRPLTTAEADQLVRQWRAAGLLTALPEPTPLADAGPFTDLTRRQRARLGTRPVENHTAAKYL